MTDSFTPFHWKLALMMGLTTFFDGFDLFNAAYVMPLVRASWHPSPALIGVMLSSGIVGLALGSLIQGPLSDKFGRLRVLISALWLLAACNLVIATTVDGPSGFIASRLLLGMALGMVTPLVLTYLNEWAPRRHANIYVNWVFQIGLSAGGLFAGLCGILLTPRFDWQVLYYLGTPVCLIAIAAAIWLPESIQYVQAKQRVPIGILFSPHYRRTTFVAWVAGFLSLFCIHGLTGWLPTIVVTRGAAISSAFAYGSLLMLAALAGGIAAGWLADLWGNRARTIVLGFLLAAVSMVGLGLLRDALSTSLLVGAAGFAIFGAQAVLNNYQAMGYPAEVRGTGLGMAVGINRVGGILGPSMIGLLSSFGGGDQVVFLALAGAALAAGGVMAFGEPCRMKSETIAATASGASSRQ